MAKLNPPDCLKLTAFYSLNGFVEKSSGWSDTIYVSGTDMTSAKTKYLSWVNARLACTAADVTFEGGRISTPSAPRRVQVVSPLDAGITFRVGQIPGVSADPGSPILLHCTTLTFRNNSRFFHCPPAANVTAPSLLNVADPFGTPFTSYLAQVAGTLVVHGPAPGTTEAIDTIFPLRLSDHRVGRPFLSARGHR